MARKTSKIVASISSEQPLVKSAVKIEIIDKKEPPSLSKSILNVLNGSSDSIERLAFEVDPATVNQYQGLYRQKMRLIPDNLLKRIAIQDDLVAAIIQARQNHVSSFGRPRPDRYKTGFIIEPKTGVLDKLDKEQKETLTQRITEATEKFYTCGATRGWADNEALTFSEWLSMSTRNALVVGRIATEIIWVNHADGTKSFHSFRNIDAGTIYQAVPQKQAAESVRRSARHMLEQIKNKKLMPERFENDEYAFVQVIDGTPVQAFTAEECRVHNFYQVPDVELCGYPVTPLDTVISAVTTHINITTHNKLYFQSGRASRGMLVIKFSSSSLPRSITSTIAGACLYLG
jgi:hypothetical protein